MKRKPPSSSVARLKKQVSLESLPAPERDVLEVAAGLELPFQHWVEPIVEGVHPGRAADAIRRLIEQGVVDLGDQSELPILRMHPVLRRTIEEAPGTARQDRLESFAVDHAIAVSEVEDDPATPLSPGRLADILIAGHLVPIACRRRSPDIAVRLVLRLLSFDVGFKEEERGRRILEHLPEDVLRSASPLLQAHLRLERGRRLEDTAEGLEEFRLAVSFLEEAIPRDLVRLRIAYREIARLHTIRSEGSEAVSWARRALEFAERTFEPASRELAEHWRCLAAALRFHAIQLSREDEGAPNRSSRADKAFAESKELFARAIDVFESLSTDHWDLQLVLAYRESAFVSSRLNDKAEAARLQRLSVEVDSRRGMMDGDWADEIHRLAVYEQALGNLEEAAKLAEKAALRFDEIYETGAPETIESFLVLSEIRRDLGDYEAENDALLLAFEHVKAEGRMYIDDLATIPAKLALNAVRRNRRPDGARWMKKALRALPAALASAHPDPDQTSLILRIREEHFPELPLPPEATTS